MSFHVMIDLETFATTNNAFIISLGAVKFNKEGVHDMFYSSVHTAYETEGFDVSPETVMWWLEQSEKARQALKDSPLKLSRVLHDFATFVKGAKGIWGNGATFDNIILRNAYTKLKIKSPWSFRQDRCFRTLVNMYPREEVLRTGTQHNALDDAIIQAKVIVLLANKHNIKL